MTREGRTTGLIARSGWKVFALVGVGIGLLLTLAYALTGQDYDPTLGGRIVGGLLSVPVFAVVGVLLGLPVQFATRAWSRRVVARPPSSTPSDVEDPGLGGSWAEAYDGCAASVTAFHAVERTLDAGPARHWFAEMGGTLDRELAAALRLAQLGGSLEAAGSYDAAAGVAERLDGARAAFAETVDRAASTALDLRADTDLADVRVQLDVLAEQAPNLRSAP